MGVVIGTAQVDCLVQRVVIRMCEVQRKKYLTVGCGRKGLGKYY